MRYFAALALLAACASDPAPAGDAGAGDASATPDTGAATTDAAAGTCSPSCILGERCVSVDGVPRCVTASQEMSGLCPGRVTCRTGDAAYACREPVCGGCVDLSSDPANCGACGRACPSGQVCFLRVCSTP